MAPIWTPFCPEPTNPNRDHRAVAQDICLYCGQPGESPTPVSSLTVTPSAPRDPAPPTANYTSRGHLPQLPQRAQIVPEAASNALAATAINYLPIRPNQPFKGKASGLIKRRGGQGPSSTPPTLYQDELESFIIFVAHGSSFDVAAEDFQWRPFSQSWNTSFRTNQVLDLHEFKNSLLRVIRDWTVPIAFKHITDPRGQGQWAVAKYRYTTKRRSLTNLSGWDIPKNIRDIIHYFHWQTNRELKEHDVDLDAYSVTLQWIPPRHSPSSSPEPVVEVPQKAPSPFYISETTESRRSVSALPTTSEIFQSESSASALHKRSISEVTPRAEREQEFRSYRPPHRPEPQEPEEVKEQEQSQTHSEARPQRANKGKKPKRYGH